MQFLGVGAIYKGANLNILLFIASLLKCCDIIHGINNLSVLSAYEFNTLLSQRKIGFPELAWMCILQESETLISSQWWKGATCISINI